MAGIAQGMRGNKPAPNGWPRAIVPFLHFLRSTVAIVLGRDQLLVRRAVLPVRQLRAAGIAAWMLWFSGHFPCLRFLLIHYSQCTHGQSFQVRFESILVRFSPIESGIFEKMSAADATLGKLIAFSFLYEAVPYRDGTARRCSGSWADNSRNEPPSRKTGTGDNNTSFH